MDPQQVNTAEEWVLGVDHTPFFTKRWFPLDGEPKAYIVFVHGFAEHLQRYDPYFRKLAGYGLHIFAFDQRGFGRTGNEPLTASSPEVAAWKKDGSKYHLLPVHKGKNGGYPKVFPDIEFWIKREAERAKGKKLFLYGHSMGGAMVLGFASRTIPPPDRETLKLLSGVIASGPFIRPTTKLPMLQVAAGRFFNYIGLGSFVLNTGLKVEELCNNDEVVKCTSEDPWCEPVGSLSTIAPMIGLGESLDSAESWKAWPEDLPILVYHGAVDPICCPNAAERFVKNVVAKDKTFGARTGMLHEPHNEIDPEPTALAETVASWVLDRSGEERAKL